MNNFTINIDEIRKTKIRDLFGNIFYFNKFDYKNNYQVLVEKIIDDVNRSENKKKKYAKIQLEIIKNNSSDFYPNAQEKLQTSQAENLSAVRHLLTFIAGSLILYITANELLEHILFLICFLLIFFKIVLKCLSSMLYFIISKREFEFISYKKSYAEICLDIADRDNEYIRELKNYLMFEQNICNINIAIESCLYALEACSRLIMYVLFVGFPIIMILLIDGTLDVNVSWFEKLQKIVEYFSTPLPK